MRIAGIVAASVAALLVGARLVLAGFAPVLPPDFHRKADADFEDAYWRAFWRTGEQVEFYLLNGRWATSARELVLRGPQGDMYERWRVRDERDFRRYVDELEWDMEFVSVDARRSIVRYPTLAIENGRVVGSDGTVACNVTLDVEYARAWEAWYANPGARASRTEPPEVDRWRRMDCRRGTGLRAWLSWAGLDRYDRRPPERYSAMTYARRAWERAGVTDPTGESRDR